MTGHARARDGKQAIEMTREQRLARAFVRLADTLAPGFDPLRLFDELVSQCIALLDADAGGVLVADARGGMRIMAASPEDAAGLELLQLLTGEGPCVDCYRVGAPLTVADLDAERDRWPDLAGAAPALGYRSTCTVPLRLHSSTIGALNLFRREAGPIPPADAGLAQALADSAALSLLHWSADPAGDGEVLIKTQAAIAYRNALEIAKGMIAHHAHVPVAAATDLLRRYAAARGASLVAIVRALVDRTLAPSDVVARAETPET
ncbi:GAF and ANTAR domain-containing protein [Streptomyces antimicrobicus]|uniref:GAF and ANTAR domain-containing protein n=1 Tax=Streptomyces antimicrobicus TaxID=2883108 RepID=A0ABS8B2E1_9ACTN|nr:GAF and ANTAR domain-containing protein [Streptomyces antimicrobicus]MCB5178768.1 GAF and ANTAR domain-containing protein [Streptomyces antimicrobicus]